MQLEVFHAEIRRLDNIAFVRQYITNGECAVMTPDEHMRVKTSVAAEFNLHPHCVVAVGSAKLGFSIAPNKRYIPFGNHSDIDLAIVDATLFDQFWRDAFLFAQSGADWEQKKFFFKRLGEGWIRPDILPRNEEFPARTRWFEFFRGQRAETESGEISIKAGLFKDQFFLENYHAKNVRDCLNVGVEV